MSETVTVKEANIVDLNQEEYETVSQVFLPEDAYDIYFAEVEASESKNTKTPCLNYKAEIIGPDVVYTEDDKTVNPVGILFKNAIYYSVSKGEKKGNCAQIRQLHESFGLPLAIDFNNPDPSWFQGKKARITLKTEEFGPTNAKGEPIIDHKGNAVVRLRYRITNILGPIEDAAEFEE